MRIRAKVIMVAIVLALLFTAAMVAIKYIGQEAEETQLPVLGEAPDFALTNQDGQEVRLSHFRGKVVIMDFIYARCPDVCILLNEKLKIVRAQLDEGLRQDLVLISISFDPLDTPEVLREYAADWGYNTESWHFLTGSEAQIAQVTADYGLTYQMVEMEGGHSHLYTHNVVVVLIDRDGMKRKVYSTQYISEIEMIADITSLLSRP